MKAYSRYDGEAMQTVKANEVEVIEALVRAAEEADFSNSPDILFRGELRAALIERGIDEEMAEEVAADIEVCIGEGTLSTTGVRVAACACADIVLSHIKALQSRGFRSARALARMASRAVTLDIEVAH